MMGAAIDGVAVWGPGLAGWDAAREVLAGPAGHDATADTSPTAPTAAPPVPDFLSSTERRRAGLAVRLALAAAQQAVAMAGRDPAGLRSIFASANGDGALMHAILETLSVPGRPVSPTQFHNSVHNAAAGYWTIGHGAHAPATCLGCHDATFAASLLKAATEVVIERAPVLLCVYDVALPPPLFAQRPVQGAFAAAFVLAPETERGTLGRIALEYRAESAPDAEIEPRAPGLAPMARANPAARALRLLEALASARPDRFAAPLLDGSVRIAYQP